LDLVFETSGLTSKSSEIRTYGFSVCFWGSKPGIDFSFLFSKNELKDALFSVCAVSGGGRTLPFHDLGMILALFNEGVCDGGHWAGVMDEYIQWNSPATFLPS
jgi:hypothetical protein